MALNKNIESYNSKFVAVLKAAFGLIDYPIELSRDELLLIEETAKRQSVLYIAVAGLKKAGYEDALTESMKACIPKTIYDYYQRHASLNEIAQAFTETNIEFVPLKGLVLCDFYPEPCMRTSSDIDILVKPECLKRAIETAENKTSFTYSSQGHHDVHFFNSHVHLELHFSLLANILPMDKVLEKVWDYVVRDDNNGWSRLVPEYQLFYTVAHSAKHFIQSGGVGIRPLLDIWLLQTKTTYDESVVRSLLDEAGIIGYYDVCNEMLSVWFGEEDYSETTRIFEELIFSGSVFGSEYTKVIAHERKNKGSKYIFTRIFRSGKDIKEMYPVCSKYPFLIPFYQVVRWTHLTRSTKRKAAKNELKQLKSLNQIEIEKYDKLIKVMRL